MLPGWICTSAETLHLLGTWCADHRACNLDECWAVWDRATILKLCVADYNWSLFKLVSDGSVWICEHFRAERGGRQDGWMLWRFYSWHFQVTFCLMVLAGEFWQELLHHLKRLQFWWGRPVEKEQMPQPQPDAAANWARVLQSPAQVNWCLAVLTTRRRKSLGAAVTLQLHWQYFCS